MPNVLSASCAAPSRGVRHSTAEHTHCHRQRSGIVGVEEEIVATQHRQNVEYHHAPGHHVHLDTVLLERLEETRAHLQTDAVDEENQSEVLNEIKHFGRTGKTAIGVLHTAVVVDVSHHDTGEQHERDAKRNAAYLELAEHNANSNHQREQQHDVCHRVGCEKKRL